MLGEIKSFASVLRVVNMSTRGCRDCPVPDCGAKSGTNVASVGSVFNNTRKVKVLSLPETIQEKIDVSSEGPSSGVSSGGQGKTTRVFIRVNTKTSRDKIKANQMDFIKTK